MSAESLRDALVSTAGYGQQRGWFAMEGQSEWLSAQLDAIIAAARREERYRVSDAVNDGAWDESVFKPVLTRAIAAARAGSAAEVERLRRLVERSAAMGYCSQTGHEHLMRDAQVALATPTPKADR